MCANIRACLRHSFNEKKASCRTLCLVNAIFFYKEDKQIQVSTCFRDMEDFWKNKQETDNKWSQVESEHVAGWDFNF